MVDIRRLGFADADFALCMAIRLQVFVAEQKVPLAEERDGLDDDALHYLARVDGEAAGTARVVLKPDDCVKITRVAVLPAARGQHIGAALMRFIEADVPAAVFMLDAQSHALNFYRRLGYYAQGAEFLEAGIPHFHMVKASRSFCEQKEPKKL